NRLASVTPGGVLGNDASSAPSLSRDGDVVTFASNATTFGAGPGTHLFVRNLRTGTLDVAGRADGIGGAPVALVLPSRAGPLVRADGSSVAFVARAPSPIAPGDRGDNTPQLFERNLAAGTTRLVSRATGATGAALPAPGSVVPRGITADGGC